MAVRVKSGGVWVTPAAGNIRVKSGGAWRTVVSLRVDSGNVWRDSGYVSYPNAPTNLTWSEVGNGDNRYVNISWNAPVGGAPVSYYRVEIYGVSDNLLTSFVRYVTNATVTFDSNNTTRYIRVFSVYEPPTGGTLSSSASNRIRVDIGAAGYWVDPPGYWGSSRLYKPAFDEGQSNTVYQNAESYGGNAFDSNNDTVWSGSSWSYNGGYDWVSFRTNNAVFDNGANRKRLTGVLISTAGNPPGQRYLDFDIFGGWVFVAGSSGYESFQGLQTITVPESDNFIINGNLRFRVNFTLMGVNPTSFGTYRVIIREIALYIQDWIDPAPYYVPPGGISVSNA